MSNGGRRGGGWGSAVGVLIVIGLVIKFIWWILGVLALVAIAYAVKAVVRQHHVAMTERQRRMAEIATRADQQHTWVLAGDARGTYGQTGAELMRIVVGSPRAHPPPN